MSNPSENTLEFGKFAFDTLSESLYRQGKLVPLQEKPAKILKALLLNPGSIVSRQTIIEALWADGTHVDFDNNLNASVRKLREALGDSASDSLYVETVPKQGYRFVAPVQTENVQQPIASTLKKPFNFQMMIYGLIAAFILGFSLAFLLPGATTTQKTMLAFLPFQILGEAGDLEALSDGLTEELISQCGSIAPLELGVIAGTSARTYRNTEKTAREIGQELGVGYLVEGTLQQEANQLRITTQLIRVSDQSQVWSKVYTRELTQLFELRREIGIDITQRLAATLEQQWAVPNEAVLARGDYQNYLKARYLMSQNHASSFQKAADILEKLVIQSPEFTAGSALLSEAYTLAAIYGGEPSDTLYQKGEQVALLTLARDGKNGLALTSMGYNLLYYQWDWIESGSYFRNAQAVSPGLSKVQSAAASWFSVVGRHVEAVEAAERAKLLDPFSASVNNDLAWYYYYAGDFKKAMAQHAYMLELDPNSDTYCAMLCHWIMGDHAQAFQKVQALLPKNETVQKSFSEALAKGQAEANQWLVDALLQSPVKQNRYLLANRQVALGQFDDAMVTIKQAWQERAPWAAYAPVDPGFQQVYQHPSFQALVKTMKLPVVLRKGRYVPDPSKF